MRLLVGTVGAGKSTLGARWSEIHPQEPSPMHVHFGFEIADESAIPTGPDDLVHFNLLRGYRAKSHGTVSASTSPLLPELIDAAEEVIILAAPLPVLLRRVKERGLSEPEFEAHAHRKFNGKFWGGVLRSGQLPQILEQLVLHLDQLRKPYRCLCSNGEVHDAFQPLSRWELPRLALPGAEKLCRHGHVVQQLDVGERSYQADYRDGSARAARSATLERALRMPLQGKRVLDIGCAEGAAALSAYRMGAKVTAIEPWSRRFDQAQAIAKALDSPIDLRKIYLEELSDPPGSYDVVLALNVIHHQPNPFAFLDRAAALSSSHLVLEYPGLNDRRFRSTVDHAGDLSETLPLVGVSTAEQDQTFVFTPASLERYLIDTAAVFGKHEVIPSPKENRWISVFSEKAPASASRRKSEQARLVEDRARYAGELERLRSDIRRMRRSRSWRLTAPLRAAHVRLSRLRARRGAAAG